MNQIEGKLVKCCIENALALFKEMGGEFYPFGCVYTKGDKVAIYYNRIDEEFPPSINVLNDLILNLYFDIKNNKYISASTCALATKKIDDITYEFLDIRLVSSDNTQKDYCVVIYPDYVNNTFEYEEAMEFTGTFKETAIKLIR